MNEPAKIHYTLDGSTPDENSPLWEAQGPRRPGQVFGFEETTTLKWIAEDIKANVSDVQSATFHIDTDAPEITITTPTDGGQYLIGSEVHADFECADADAGVEVCVGTVPSGSPIDTSTVGFHPFQVDAQDYAGNTASTEIAYQVIWPFSGFTPPVKNPPAENNARGGSAVPVKFSLGGNRGPGIFEASYPVSRRIDCNSSAPQGALQPTVAAEELVYEDGQYKYVWKTQKAWGGTCRELILGLIDGTEHRAVFKFS